MDPFYNVEELSTGFSAGTATLDEPLILTLPDVHGETEEFDVVGKRTSSVSRGIHSFFIARVPYIPSFRTVDFARLVSGTANGRVEVIMQRQIQFLNDLANARSFKGCSFALRYIAAPDPLDDTNSRIDIVFIGKTFRPVLRQDNMREARRVNQEGACQLWTKFRAHFPSNEPFNYQLEPVNDRQEFLRYFQPISFVGIAQTQIIEIHKYEDYDFIGYDDLPRQYHLYKKDYGYYPHPFSPALKSVSAMSGLAQVLAHQRHITVLNISLRPTELASAEFDDVADIMDKSTRIVEKDVQVGSMKVPVPLDKHRRHRADEVMAAYTHLANQRHRLFTMKIQIVGEREAPEDVVEAIGSELVDHQNITSRFWQMYRPSDDASLSRCIRDFAYLEHQSKQTHPLTASSSARPPTRQEVPDTGGTCAPLERLPFLVSSFEAAGAFRLPVPPESGYLPGLTVMDEPFVRPTLQPLQSRSGRGTPPSVVLGEILHRGTTTGQHYRIGLDKLARHGLIAGSTGSGKTNTSLNLLTDLWQQDVSFLVIYPIDKPDYRKLMYDERVRDKLLVYTVGDETVAPFRFNPFAVPDGILLRTHLNLLMRCFSAAFYMWDVLPSIYRNALRKCYINAGWAADADRLLSITGGDHNPPPPSLADFYRAVDEATNEEVGLAASASSTEYMSNVRQGAVSRIRDLLASAGHVINTVEAGPFAELLDRPVVMEVGRVGSSEDIALIMAFLLVSLVEELQKRLRGAGDGGQRSVRQHVTLLEEAHQLMPAAAGGGGRDQPETRGKSSEEFSNILAEVRGFRESILIAEQIPSSLVTGAVANTHVKVMHWLESPTDFELFGRIMNLNESQKIRARTLATGEAIVRDEMSQPVHVRVPAYGATFPSRDVSDEELRAFMTGRNDNPPIPVRLSQPDDLYASPLAAAADASDEAVPDELTPTYTMPLKKRRVKPPAWA